MLENCKKFNSCNAPICPLDQESKIRVKYSEDDICSYCRKRKSQGKRKKLPKELIKHIPQQNIKLLTEKNQKFCQDAL